MHWHRKCPSTPNCKYHTGIPLGQARNQSKGLQPRRPAGPSRDCGWCWGRKLTPAAASSPLGHALHWAGSCCQTSVGTAGWKGWGEATAQTAHLTSRAAKYSDSAKGRLGSVHLTAGAEGAYSRPPRAYTRAWAPAQTGRLVAEAHAGEQLPSERGESVFRGADMYRCSHGLAF